MSGEEDEEGFVYLRADDALEAYAAIFGLTTAESADHLRSREALEGACSHTSMFGPGQPAVR